MPTREELTIFVVNTLSELIELPPAQIKTDIDIGEYGVDSVMAVMLAEEINMHFKYEIADFSDFVGLSTIEDMAAYLTAGVEA